MTIRIISWALLALAIAWAIFVSTWVIVLASTFGKEASGGDFWSSVELYANAFGPLVCALILVLVTSLSARKKRGGDRQCPLWVGSGRRGAA
jgi:hypothetical protein